MKTFIALACLAVVALSSANQAEARPKRSLILTSPVLTSSVVAAPAVVASVPVAHSTVVHSSPTTVVKTEQVHSGGQSSYSYSTETKANAPVVHTVAAAPVATAVAAAPIATAVSTVHHTVPTYAYGYYPAYGYSAYGYPYYSPYSYLLRK